MNSLRDLARIVRPAASVRTAIALLGAAAGVAMPLTARATPPACPPAHYDVSGPPLLGGSSAGIVYARSFVNLDTGCTPGKRPFTARGTKGGTRVRGRWDGCTPFSYPVRLTASIDPSCTVMTGTISIPKFKMRQQFIATRTSGSVCNEEEGTFEQIQTRIFGDRGCTVSTCHGNAYQAGLDLRPGAAHLALVNALPTNSTAASAGKVRVKPFDLSSSFLLQKLEGILQAGEGGVMPPLGQGAGATELEAVRAWILAGAPATGSVEGAPCLVEPNFAPAPPLDPPAGGHQLVLSGPILQPGEEVEGCMWLPTPNATDFIAEKWEFSLNPGSHHFAIFRYSKPGAPATGVFHAGDVACISGAEFGNPIAGSPQSPYFISTYPEGVGRLLPAGGYLGLNAHYHNPYSVPVQVKVWINIYPAAGPVAHLAKTIIDFDDMFGIDVPPYSQATLDGHYYGSGPVRHIYNLTGHMHKRGLRFTAWSQAGVKLYENFDWSHPVSRIFDPPFDLAAGQRIDYQCLHDNGVTRDLKVDSLGNPIALTFGLTTDDEMCTVNGEYYDD